MSNYTIHNCANCKHSMFLDSRNISHCEIVHRFVKAYQEVCKKYTKKENNDE